MKQRRLVLALLSLLTLSAFGDDGVPELVFIPDINNDKPLDLSPKKATQDDIIAFFAKVLPNYDTDRVRVSDMRKVLSWYNILTADGYTEFVSKEEEGSEEEATEK